MKGCVDGREFNIRDLEEMEWSSLEVKRLADLGLVETEEAEGPDLPASKFVLWSQGRCRVSAGSFVWWVRDNAISNTRKTVDFERLLHDREYEGLLTREWNDKLKRLIREVPKKVAGGAGEFLGLYLKGWLGVPPKRSE